MENFGGNMQFFQIGDICFSWDDGYFLQHGGNIEYFLTEKGKSLNKIIYYLVEYTLDNNKDLYNKETAVKAKEGFKKQLLD